MTEYEDVKRARGESAGPWWMAAGFSLFWIIVTSLIWGRR